MQLSLYFALVALATLSSAFAAVHRLQVDRIFVKNPHHSSLLERILSNKNSSQQRLTDYGNWLYVANTTIGTPKQTFRLLMDTGSSTLWVPDKTAHLSSPFHKFDSSKSSTYVKDGRRMYLGYGAGDVQGFYGKDEYCFHDGLCAKDYVFGQGQYFDRGLPDKRFDGICGLGFGGLNEYSDVVPAFMRVIDQLDKPIFSFWAGTALTASKTAGGEIVFGAEDPAHCEPVKNWVPVIKTDWSGQMVYGFWRYKIDSVSINGKTLGRSMTAFSDTGGPICQGPSDQVGEMARTVGAKRIYDGKQYQYKIDCGATPPDIVFTIDGNKYPITYHKYISKDTENPSRCFFGIVSGGPYNSWYMGDTFIRQFCHVHDPKNKKIAFAKSKM